METMTVPSACSFGSRWALAAPLALVCLWSLSGCKGPAIPPSQATSVSAPPLKPEDKACMECHAEVTPGIVKQWKGSGHARHAVGCYTCHQARKGEPDAFAHNGKVIATIVTPKDCGRCHAKVSKEFQRSHHASAGNILASLDNLLGEVVEGPPAVVSGCLQCHGSRVKVLPGGKLDPKTWPNTGIGRLNPDGSKGSCSACHSRHSFSRALARRPENCGKCHLGPDHPQIEIYNESKHGVAFRANVDKMNLDAKHWQVGVDYFAAPTCATCHMGATASQGSTHDVGARISWTLRPVISKRLPHWKAKRRAMKSVCQACHGSQWVNNFFTTFDSAVDLYNNKFAKPAQEIMAELRRSKKVTPSPFDDKIEWTFFELWHHEGRRARHGAAMMGPDYTQWHGFFEIARTFYHQFLPQVVKLGRKDLVDRVLAKPQHRWIKGLDKARRERIRRFYEKRYGK